MESPFRAADAPAAAHHDTFTVIEEPQLDALSSVRIPLGVVVFVAVAGAVDVALLRATGAPPGALSLLITLVGFGAGLYTAAKVTGRISPRGPRTTLEISNEEIRYVDHAGRSHALRNGGLAAKRGGFNRLDVKDGAQVHRLPIFVTARAGGPLPEGRYVLAVRDGQVVLHTVGRSPRPIPFLKETGG